MYTRINNDGTINKDFVDGVENFIGLTLLAIIFLVLCHIIDKERNFYVSEKIVHMRWMWYIVIGEKVNAFGYCSFDGIRL